MISDREKTSIDCIDRPALAGGVGEAATILATASPRFDWTKATDYLERIGSGALTRRFGWLVDHVEADVPDEIRDRLLQLVALSRKNMVWNGSRVSARSAGCYWLRQNLNAHYLRMPLKSLSMRSAPETK